MEVTKERIQIMIDSVLATAAIQNPVVAFFAIIFIGICLIKGGGEGFPKF